VNIFRYEWDDPSYLPEIYLNDEELRRGEMALIIPDELAGTVLVEEMPILVWFATEAERVDLGSPDVSCYFDVSRVNDTEVVIEFQEHVPQSDDPAIENPSLIDIILKEEIVSKMNLFHPGVRLLTHYWEHYGAPRRDYVIQYIVMVKVNTFPQAVQAAHEIQADLAARVYETKEYIAMVRTPDDRM
jgi:hypothetical protein